MSNTGKSLPGDRGNDMGLLTMAARRAAPHRSVWLTAVLATLTACGDAAPPQVDVIEPADLVITNARVYSLAWTEPASDGSPGAEAPVIDGRWRPDAEAVAVRDGRIVLVGGNDAARALIGEDTTVVALDGATVLPGLVDSHTHVFNLGAALSRVSLVDVATEAEAVERIVEAARHVPEGEWIIGQGWDEGAWANRYPDMTLLTEQVPNHPVYMRSLHSFAGWGNKLAFQRAGITADTEPPVGGEIRRFANGEPNGLLLNRAVPLLENAIPPPDAAALEARVLLALEQMARDGYVTVHDAGLDAAEMAVLETLEAEGRLPIRVYAMLSVRDAELARAWLDRGPDSDNDSFLVTRSVKAFYDGALGSRGARLLEDYSDAPGHRGVSGDQYGFDQALTAAMMQAGFQVGIHAIGDAGNREALDFIESVYAVDASAREQRHRVEHAQVLHPDDVRRFAELDVIASMEPPHAVEDKAWAEDRLGPERVRGAYAWRSLRQAGARLTFNADNPGSDHDIFYGLHAAVTRRDKAREPADGWYPDQAVTIEEAVRAYTTWSAYAAFREADTGVLAPGRWADLTIMDIDPFVLASDDPGAILDGNIVMTVVAGNIVHPQ
jgi:predicted amidohydrolase YtcJ